MTDYRERRADARAAAARMDEPPAGPVGICQAADLFEWGPGANPPEDGIGVGCKIEIHVGPDGGLSIDLIGGWGPDRRVLANIEHFRIALASAGVTWAER